MVDSASPTDAGPDRAARGPSWLLLNAGTLLFVCVLLPAIESCGDPVYPIEFIQSPLGWPILLPYLLGLAAAGVAIKRLFFPTSSAHRWQIATIGLGLACYIGAAILYSFAVVSDPSVFTVPTLLVWLFVIPAFRVFNRRAALPWRCARAVWIGGAACAVHFGLFVVMDQVEGGDGDSVLFGMWLSLAAALALTVAGGLLEQQAEPPPPPDPPPLPPARVL